MFRAAWRSLVQHKLRLVLSTLAIVLSVGFVVGTLIFTDTLNKTFTDLFGQTTTDVVVTPKSDFQGSGLAGEVKTLPASLLKTVTDVPGAAKAGGQVFADGVSIIGSNGDAIGTQGAPHFGSNWDDDEDLTPYRLIDGSGPTSSGQVAIDSVSADKGDLSVGDDIKLVTPKGEMDAQLVGIFRFGTSGNLAGATIAAFDTATAQDLLLNGQNRYTEIDAVANEGVSQQQLADEVKGAVAKGITVKTGEQAADDAASEITDQLKFFNIFLLIFAGIALFVGSFLIINTFSMLISQRTRELALLRAVGATRGQVRRSILSEASVVGLVASLLGCLLGVGVVYLLRWFFGRIGLDLGSTSLALRPSSFIIGIVLGVVVTVVASWFPARRASRIPPVAALRDDATLPSRSLKLRAIIGGVLSVVGISVLITGVAISAAKGSALVGLGTLVTLVGVIVFSPVLTGPIGRFLGAPLPPMFGTVGRLAVDNASRQPRRSAATASALMIGLALVSALTIFASSATASVNAAIDRVIGAEFTISTQTQQPFPRTIADQVSKLDDVAVVSRSTFAAARVDNGTKESETFLVAVDPNTISDVLTLTFTQGSMSDLGENGIILDTNTAKDAGLAVGDPVHLTFATGKKTFTVVGLYETAGFFSGYIISNDGLQSAGVNIGDAFVYVKGAPGADLEALKGQIEDILKDYPGVQVQSQAELKKQFQSNVNLLLGLMVGLLGLAIFIAVLGIINTLFLSVLERTREIGMLRAVGTSRRQVRSMVVLESVLIALLGAVLGVILGVVFAASLQRTLAPQGVDILRIPWIQLVIFLVIAMIVGALAALWPARRAARLDVLRAITTE